TTNGSSSSARWPHWRTRWAATLTLLYRLLFLLYAENRDPLPVREGSYGQASLKREQGVIPRSRAAFGGHAGLCWSFRLVANRLASDPFDPNGAMMGTQVSH
ncbi:MAG: hypothetical protein ACXWOV_05765, partial [Isosphaeraceae bacterium]